MSWLKRNVDVTELFELRHESLVGCPKESLVRICRFLGVDAQNDYADACAGIVFQRPLRSRELTPWDGMAISLVGSRMDDYGFLIGLWIHELGAERSVPAGSGAP